MFFARKFGFIRIDGICSLIIARIDELPYLFFARKFGYICFSASVLFQLGKNCVVPTILKICSPILNNSVFILRVFFQFGTTGDVPSNQCSYIESLYSRVSIDCEHTGTFLKLRIRSCFLYYFNLYIIVRCLFWWESRSSGQVRFRCTKIVSMLRLQRRRNCHL